jgi:hypothetical protein
MMDAQSKLHRAMRILGLFHALMDEDQTHWHVMTIPAQMDAPILLDKAFVEMADPQQIADVLRQLLEVEQE